MSPTRRRSIISRQHSRLHSWMFSSISAMRTGRQYRAKSQLLPSTSTPNLRTTFEGSFSRISQIRPLDRSLTGVDAHDGRTQCRSLRSVFHVYEVVCNHNILEPVALNSASVLLWSSHYPWLHAELVFPPGRTANKRSRSHGNLHS